MEINPITKHVEPHTLNTTFTTYSVCLHLVLL